jgi:hypothetical protein
VPDDRPTKICPDCAESVLAAAQKCRFCGYRFDGRSATASGGVMGLLRRPDPAPTSVPELLQSWGIALHEDDGGATLCHGSIAGANGYIVVTECRFLFVPTIFGKAPQARREHLLSDLLRVHYRRQRLRRALFLEWRDTRTVVAADPGQLARLHDLLAPYALRRDRAGAPDDVVGEGERHGRELE